MQRSYSDDTPLVIGNGSIRLSSDETETLGFSADAHLIEDDTWARLMIYADTYDETLQNTTGLGLNVLPFRIGLFGAASITGEFERDTNLMRFDAMQRVTSFGGLDVYGGASLVSLTDTIGLDVSTPDLGGYLTEVAMDGTTSMIGFVVGGRYDLDANIGSDALSLSAFGTVGVYHASHSMRYSAMSTRLAIDEAASASETGITGAAELGVTASYALSDMSELSLTYQAAFYGDAVSTPGSVGRTDRNGGPSTEVETDSVLYHGLGMTFVLRF